MFKSSQSILNVIENNAQVSPKKIVYKFLNDSLTESQAYSYEDLLKRAKNIARFLVQRSAAGERVLLLFSPGLDFVATFLGCLYAGCIAVPFYSARVVTKNLNRFKLIIEDSGARFVLTDDQSTGLISSYFPSESLEVVHIKQLELDTYPLIALPNVSADDIACIQYTSGSTGHPKGVIIRHKNIVHNESVIQGAFGLNRESVIVGWLPFYHDMGLIGNILQPLFCGGQSVLMAPTTFLRNPRNWLQTISAYQAVCSGGPNFAFDLCVERISAKDMVDCDLSCWEVAFNGSEVVHSSTLAAFYEKFSAFGFHKKAFLPCYGMAEATLFVSGCPREEEPSEAGFDEESLAQGLIIQKKEAKKLVSSGEVNLNTDIRIINPYTQEESHHEVGEICISGMSVSEGYWRATKAQQRWKHYFKTGDLGFIYKNQLFITGRLKELIIIRGRNFVPQDIERVVQENQFLTRGMGACFSIDDDGEEKLVVVQEVKRQHFRDLNSHAIFQDIRNSIFENFGIQPFAIALIKPLTLPKTSSGKIMRLKTKEQYLKGGLQLVDQYRLETRKHSDALLLTTLLTKIENVEEILTILFHKIARIDIATASDLIRDQSLQSLGFDSLGISQLKGYLEELYPAVIDLESLYDHITFNQLLEAIMREKKESVFRDDQKVVVVI